MAARRNRRGPGSTAGQRMRSFSRSVMRHYASALPEIPMIPEPQGPPAPSWTAPPTATETVPQGIASAPLPFDTAISPPDQAPLLPLAETPVTAVTPPSVQRDTQPAVRPPAATGPDGKPLMYKGQPIPVSDEPTPPALKELLRRDRERAAAVQRLTEERAPQLKAEMPASDDPDVPHSSRLRRRGSADVDYIQTKALTDHREPGDQASKVPPKTPKAGRESEQKPAASRDDDDDANEGDGAPFPEPLVGAPAADSLQRGVDIPASPDSLPFTFPNDAPSQSDNPASLPVLQRDSEPDQTLFVPESPLTPRPVSPEIQPPTPAQPVQRQADLPPASAVTPAPAQPQIQREPVSENLPPAIMQPDRPSQRPDMQTTPLVPPQTTPAVQRTESEAPSSGLPSASHTAVPTSVVQRESAAPAPVMSESLPPLPFDPAPAAPPITQPQTPAVQRQATEPGISSAPTPPATGVDAPAVQRAAEPAANTRPSTPAHQPDGPTASGIDAAPASAAPTLQRAADPVTDTRLSTPAHQPDAPTTSGIDAATASTAPTLQRAADPVTDTRPSTTAHQPDAPTASGIDLPPASAAPSVQRVAEPAADTRPSTPAHRPDTSAAAAPAASGIDLPPASAAPALQRAAEPTSDTRPAVQSPVQPTQPENNPQLSAPAAAPSLPTPPIQRQADAAPEMADVVPPVLPFDQPVSESPAAPASTSSVVQRDMPEPEPSLPTETRQPTADAVLPVAVPAPTTLQRQTDSVPPSRSIDTPASETSGAPDVQRHTDPVSTPLIAQDAPQVVQREPAPLSVSPLPVPEVADVIPPVLPFDQPIGDAQIPTSAVPPQSQLQRQPDLSGQPSDASPQPSVSTQETGLPAVQRQLESSTPDAAIPSRDLSVPSASPIAVPPPPDIPSLTSPDTASPAPVVQRQPQVDRVDAPEMADVLPPTPEMADVIPPVLPFDQPAPDSTQSLRISQPQAAPTVQRQPESAPQSHPAASPQPDVPGSLQSLSPSAPDAVQRTPEAASPVVPPSSESSDIVQSAAPDALSIQRMPEFAAPAQTLPASQPGPESPLPQGVSSPEAPSAPSLVQREPEWATSAVDVEPAPLPFDATPAAPQSQPSDSIPPSPVMRSPSADTPSPVINRQVDSSVQPVQINSDASAQDAVTQIQSPAPPAQPAVQRQPEPGQPAAEMADVAPPQLPFDAPSVAQPSQPPAIQRRPETAAESAVSSPVDPIAAQTPPMVQPATAEPVQVQRQPAEASAPDSVAPEVQSPPADVSPLAIPFDPLPAVPSQSPPVVQRQADAAMTADQPSVSGIPFDDLQAMRSRTSRVQRQVQAAEPPPVLPFDPLPLAKSDALQRETDESVSEESPLTTGGAAQKMDVFQALVAAGMVPRPGSMPAPPASQSTVQRSPSRDAYLEQFAARESGRDVQSISEPAPVQRAISVEEVTTSVSEPSQPQSSAMDVDKLAADVMKVLRGKLRSEAERISKR